jgi:glycosyltransferase involved in cell wall biosynthesis
MNQLADLAQLRQQQRRALRVTILGIRGFPNVQGGAEKHVESLSCALAEIGCDVEAIMRSPYVAKGQGAQWRDVKLSRIWAPRIGGVEAFVHTFLGVIRAAFTRPDILHIHAIGPALFTPLARALGLRVVVTHHVLNYENEKWGPAGRSILRLGEWAGMRFANGRIAVSKGLAEQMARAYGTSVIAIPNGIDKPRMTPSTEILLAFGLSAQRYLISVARIDEQKRQLDLIAAYARLRAPEWKLALVGGADYSGSYSRAVAEAARETPGVVMLGHQTGAALAELYSHAGVFVLPSSHEGQPIAVLEAASYGLPVILSDIEAHRELDVPHARYFAVGDVAALAAHLGDVCAAPAGGRLAAGEYAGLLAKHDWRAIAQQTLAVYCDALSGSKRVPGAADLFAAKIKEPS